MSKVAVVIGAGPGLGAAVAKRFAKEGYHVVVVARTASKLESLAKEIETAGGKATALTADAGDAASIQSLFQKIRDTVGNPEVLVYNAALLKKESDVLGTSLDDFVDAYKVNVVGAFASAKEVAPKMKEAGKGAILLTSGGLALKTYPGFLTLGNGKAGIRSLGQVLHADLKPSGVQVTSFTICGFIKPDAGKFSPDSLANLYYEELTKQSDQWVDEVVIQ
eukprot:TRINITY_DN12538_c0_g1_i1.p1 TRINITY_DN12538_c0_g1~~TRINITY_DN12538_c0_g1_i1.p1  ORF type:complete len:221 (-),score=70.61 TRINITY_DN12538_c0_g1_i1:18-680(-)